MDRPVVKRGIFLAAASSMVSAWGCLARTKQTAEILTAKLNLTDLLNESDGLKPMDDPEVWIERIRYRNDDLMLVGHLPFMARLTGLLVTGDPDRSVVIGDVGFGVLPGGDQYWDYVQGRWVIPESGVNTAPFIAFGGWIISVVADSDAKEAALDFSAFMASPEMVKKLAVMPDTGINPSRFSQLEDIDLWTKAGFDRESAEDYLDAIMNTINHPNAVLDIRITGSAEYLQTLDVGVSRALAGEVSPQEGLDEVAKAWNEITDRRGRDSQLKQYRASIGLPK